MDFREFVSKVQKIFYGYEERAVMMMRYGFIYTYSLAKFTGGIYQTKR